MTGFIWISPLPHWSPFPVPGFQPGPHIAFMVLSPLAGDGCAAVTIFNDFDALEAYQSSILSKALNLRSSGIIL